jgi:hypothetical protein
VGVVPLYRLVLARPDAPVGEIMTADSVRVRTADDQEVVARVFRERRYLAVPVVDEDGRLVGVVTADDIGDVLDAARDEVASCPELRPGAAARRGVQEALQRRPELAPFRRLRALDAAVGGLVELRGHEVSPAQTHLAERCARGVPGVLGVRNRLVDDESLEHLVVHRLLRDRVAQTGSIRAVSWVGAVTLDGRVPSRAYWPCTTP